MIVLCCIALKPIVVILVKLLHRWTMGRWKMDFVYYRTILARCQLANDNHVRECLKEHFDKTYILT